MAKIRHLSTKKHLDNAKKFSKNTILNNDESHKRLLQMMIRCNIPLNKFDEPEFVSFFRECFDFSVRSRTFYRTTMLESLYNEEHNKKKI